MIVVNAIVQTTAENIAAMQQALATMEAASRAEDGCHDYTFSVEVNDPSVLRITEKWVSMESLQAHFKTPHMGEFQQAMAATPPTSIDVKFYQAEEVEFKIA